MTIKRRSFLGLLAGLPFVGEVFAKGEPGVVLPTKPTNVPMPEVKPTLGPRPSVYAGRSQTLDGVFGQDGDLYVDYSSPNYAVYQKTKGEWHAVGGLVGPQVNHGDSVSGYVDFKLDPEAPTPRRVTVGSTPPGASIWRGELEMVPSYKDGGRIPPVIKRGGRFVT